MWAPIPFSSSFQKMGCFGVFTISVDIVVFLSWARMKDAHPWSAVDIMAGVTIRKVNWLRYAHPFPDWDVGAFIWYGQRIRKDHQQSLFRPCPHHWAGPCLCESVRRSQCHSLRGNSLHFSSTDLRNITEISLPNWPVLTSKILNCSRTFPRSWPKLPLLH